MAEMYKLPGSSYEELIKIMVKHDYELAKREVAIKRVR